jgi:hypothetical protein
MAHSRNDVLASVRAIFPGSDSASIVARLDRYGVASHERERERVQLAVLKLCNGSEDKLREYVDVAKRDHRDVLFWAEYPEEARLDTPEKRKAMRALFDKFGIAPPDDLLE